MKVYAWVTGAVFGLIVIAHVLRFMQEGSHVMHDPWFVGFTLLSAVICVWGLSVGWRSRRP